SELTDLVQSYNNDVINASCALICNWAEKILKRSFNNVVEVAQFLIQQHIINPRSANAELVLSMVLSESSQSGAQKIQKPPAETPGVKRPPSPDNSAADKNKKVGVSTVAVSPPQVKKRPPEPQKAASSPQVDALVAKLPVLRPRLPTEDKFLTSSPPVRFPPPPVLASTILPGHLKVSPLPFPPGLPLAVTAGVNGTGLVPQPAAPPVISMLLPPDAAHPEPPPKANQNGVKEPAGESRAAKRPAPSEEGPSKRKRGRPRKVDAPGKGPAAGRSAPENPAHNATAAGSPQQSDSAAPLPADPAPQVRRSEVVPNQVSVIQDGRQSLVQWSVRTAEQRSHREGASPAQADPEWLRVKVD
ncbi:DNA-binding protein RFX5-like, partial [Mantella aurantiaca]